MKRRAIAEARRLAADLKARLTADDVTHRSSSEPAGSQQQNGEPATARATIDNADCHGSGGGGGGGGDDQSRLLWPDAASTAVRPRSSFLVGGGFSGGGSRAGGSASGRRASLGQRARRHSGTASRRQLAPRMSADGQRSLSSEIVCCAAAGGESTSSMAQRRDSLCGSAAASATSCKRFAHISGRTVKRRSKGVGSARSSIAAAAVLSPLTIIACSPSVRPASHAGRRPCSSWQPANGLVNGNKGGADSVNVGNGSIDCKGCGSASSDGKVSESGRNGVARCVGHNNTSSTIPEPSSTASIDGSDGGPGFSGGGSDGIPVGSSSGGSSRVDGDSNNHGGSRFGGEFNGNCSGSGSSNDSTSAAVDGAAIALAEAQLAAQPSSASQPAAASSLGQPAASSDVPRGQDATFDTLTVQLKPAVPADQHERADLDAVAMPVVTPPAQEAISAAASPQARSEAAPGAGAAAAICGAQAATGAAAQKSARTSLSQRGRSGGAAVAPAVRTARQKALRRAASLPPVCDLRFWGAIPQPALPRMRRSASVALSRQNSPTAPIDLLQQRRQRPSLSKLGRDVMVRSKENAREVHELAKQLSMGECSF